MFVFVCHKGKKTGNSSRP